MKDEQVVFVFACDDSELLFEGDQLFVWLAELTLWKEDVL